MKLKKDLYYVGVNDRTKDLFESLWPLPQGISYNSYLMVDDKTALIDTVDVNFFEEYLYRIRKAPGDCLPDILLIKDRLPLFQDMLSPQEQQ